MQAQLPPGWAAHPATGTMAGSFFYTDPQGASHWELPAAVAAPAFPQDLQPQHQVVYNPMAAEAPASVANPMLMAGGAANPLRPTAAGAARGAGAALPAAPGEDAVPQEPASEAERHREAIYSLKGHWIVCYGSYAAFFVAVVTMMINVFQIGGGFAENAENTAAMSVAVANAAAVRAARDAAWSAWALANQPLNLSNSTDYMFNLTNMTILNVSTGADYLVDTVAIGTRLYIDRDEISHVITRASPVLLGAFFVRPALADIDVSVNTTLLNVQFGGPGTVYLASEAHTDWMDRLGFVLDSSLIFEENIGAHDHDVYSRPIFFPQNISFPGLGNSSVTGVPNFIVMFQPALPGLWDNATFFNGTNGTNVSHKQRIHSGA